MRGMPHAPGGGHSTNNKGGASKAREAYARARESCTEKWMSEIANKMRFRKNQLGPEPWGETARGAGTGNKGAGP